MHHDRSGACSGIPEMRILPVKKMARKTVLAARTASAEHVVCPKFGLRWSAEMGRKALTVLRSVRYNKGSSLEEMGQWRSWERA